ncbi:hypothetical protein DV738_g1878, partial [Chaetothyriales sp. CBS 135597]
MAASARNLDHRLDVRPVGEVQAKLTEHFVKYPNDEYVKGWADLWEKSFLPWDKGRSSPALEDTLRALVPGCGRGYDVLLLESFGYDAVGLEVSEGAIKAALKFAEEHGGDSSSTYPVRDEKAGKGSHTFVLGDFYEDDFLSELGLLASGERFDLIYDYTFFCAMRLEMRPAWAKRMSELLADSPSARLICLEFPSQKPPSTGGPPHASPPEAYLAHLSHPGEEVVYDEEGKVKPTDSGATPPNPAALERIGHWHPADTNGMGKDESGNVQDYISVWRHR